MEGAEKERFTSSEASPRSVQVCLVRKGPVFSCVSYTPQILFIHPRCHFKGFVTLKVKHHKAGNVTSHTNAFPCFQQCKI